MTAKYGEVAPVAATDADFWKLKEKEKANAS